MTPSLIRWVGPAILVSLLAAAACDQPNTNQTDTQDNYPDNSRNALVYPEGNENRSAYQPGVLLIKFRKNGLQTNGLNPDALMAELRIESTSTPTPSGISVVKILGNESVLHAAARLKKDPRIDLAEPNWRIELLAHPNDPMFADQWHLHNTGQHSGKEDADIDAPEAWGMTTTNLEEIVVALIDSGVDRQHPDLSANIWVNPLEQEGQAGLDDDNNGFVDDVYGWNFAENNNDVSDAGTHATHLAGLIGAVGNNDMLVTGVAWKSNIKIMPVRFVQADPNEGFVLDAAHAIEYAVNMGADLINCSWWTKGKKSQTLQEAITYAQKQGVVVVAAAGDHRLDNDRTVLDVYPAEYENPNVISVTATDNFDRPASFSNWGSTSVDIAAPGVNILSTWNRAKPSDPLTGMQSGSSTSSAITAGAVSVLLHQKPDLITKVDHETYDYGRLRDVLFLSVDPIAGLERKTVSGGRINLHRALLLAAGQSLSPVALTGGNRLVRVGTPVQIDASESFDPNGAEITDYDWHLTKPVRSQAQLDFAPGSARFTPDVCGRYEVRLRVYTQNKTSEPSVAIISAMYWEHLDKKIETDHPYPKTTSMTVGELKKSGATSLAPHFAAFDTEFDWDHIVLYDPKTESVLDHFSGPRGEFVGPALNVDHVVVKLVSQDKIINDYGIIIDSFYWCNENESCPSGVSDCDLDKQTGEGGCETDTRTDPVNCGWCGHVCSINATAATCEAGLCDASQMTCFQDYADCNQESYDGCEIRLPDDPKHCGACQNECNLPNVDHHGCVEGACTIVICQNDPLNASTFADCNQLIEDGCEINTHTDPNHCGECGQKCSLLDVSGLANVVGATGECVNANCRLECKPGWHDCNQRQDDGCESDLSDRFNCGSCANLCHFPLAQSICADPENGTCEMGACVNGFEDCDQNPKNGCEISITTDMSNCGGCQIPCLSADNADANCLLGTCMQFCLPRYADCDKNMANGCEIDLLADPDHCGACEKACGPYANATASCSDGICQMVCNQPFFDCDGQIETGCEIDTSNDPLHCGRCQDACETMDNADSVCVASQCKQVCVSGYGDCDNDPASGCEINLETSLEHCGTCANKCPQRIHANTTCVAGQCNWQCQEGWGDCNQKQIDGCETRLNSQSQCPGAEEGCATAGTSKSFICLFCMLFVLAWFARRI